MRCLWKQRDRHQSARVRPLVRLLLEEIMFENLTNKFEGILDTFKKAPSLNEKQVDEGLKLIRQALLEADVSLEVVKDFVTKVKPKLLGKEIIRKKLLW